ncbi:hypothetical protein BC941DRAFT_519117 [Chlamydoabsidia padenii]|nr:hypothetical protein BC941DRAFT_519117 [Chlamydoabsidia padenii]
MGVLLMMFFKNVACDQQYQGFQPMHDDPTVSNYHPEPIKCIAYAVDVCVIIKDQHDFDRLWTHMNNYSSVSNARFNTNKTEAFSLTRTEEEY